MGFYKEASMRGTLSKFVAFVAIAFSGCASGQVDGGPAEQAGGETTFQEEVAQAEYGAYSMPTAIDVRTLPTSFVFVPKGCQNLVEVRSQRNSTTLSGAAVSGWIVYGVCTRPAPSAAGAATAPFIAWAIFGAGASDYGKLAGQVATAVATASFDNPIGHGGNGVIVRPCCKGPTGLPGPDRIMQQALTADMNVSAGWAAF